jgi:diguanylate cyclase (GGDEF)-like protein
MRRVSLTLEQHIAGLFAVLAVALVAAALLATNYFGRKEAVRSVNEGMTTVAHHFADALDYGMFERFREIRLLALNEQIRDNFSRDPAAVRTILTRRQSSLPELAWLGVAAADGTVRAASQGMLEGISVAARPWFQEGLKRPWAGDLHEAKLLAPLLGQTPGGEPFRFVDVTAPVLDGDGKTIAVVGAHLSWTWASDVRANLVESGSLDIEAMILSTDGKVLLGPDVGSTPFSEEQLARMKLQRKGSFETIGHEGMVLNGFAVTAGFRDYPGLGWIAVARRPAAAAFARVDAVSGWVTLTGSGLALLGVGLAWWLARRLTRPIRAITAAAGRIGRDPHATMPRLTGPREIGQLSTSLRALVRHVDAAERQAEDVSAHSLVAAKRFEQEISALRVEADTDPLTGLFNRRAFLASAEDAMNYHRRYGRNFGILVADIDFFKRVNDTYGHAAGDAVIQNVAKTLSELVRTTDKVARFGGEEFVVLLREIGDDGIEALAQRMRQAVRRAVLTLGQQNISVSISIGGTLVSDRDKDIHDVIERADHALYDAKAAGRNAVVMASHSVETKRAA